VGHTLLQLIDKSTGQQCTNPHVKLGVFVSNLRSALPQALNLLRYNKERSEVIKAQDQVSNRSGIQAANVTPFTCPHNTHWESDMSEDIHVQSPIMNVLSMDGKRRWLDIEKLVCTHCSVFIAFIHSVEISETFSCFCILLNREALT